MPSTSSSSSRRIGEQVHGAGLPEPGGAVLLGGGLRVAGAIDVRERPPAPCRPSTPRPSRAAPSEPWLSSNVTATWLCAGQRQQGRVRDVEVVRHVLQLRQPPRLERLTGCSAGMWSIDWSRPGHRLRSSTSCAGRQPGRPLGLEQDRTAGWAAVRAGARPAAVGGIGRLGGEARAGRHAAVVRVVRQREHHRARGRPGRGIRPHPEQVEQRQLVLVRRLVQARRDRREVAGQHLARARRRARRRRASTPARSRPRRAISSATNAAASRGSTIGRERRSSWRCPFFEVEGIDEVVQRVGRPHAVVDLDGRAGPCSGVRS